MMLWLIPSISDSVFENNFVFDALKKRDFIVQSKPKSINIDGYIGLNQYCYSLGGHNLSWVDYLINNIIS